MIPRYKVTLTEEERNELQAQAGERKTAARKFIYARALLLCDAGPHGPSWKVVDVAQALGITSRTIEHLKQRFVEQGLASALERKPSSQVRSEIAAWESNRNNRIAKVDWHFSTNDARIKLKRLYPNI